MPARKIDFMIDRCPSNPQKEWENAGVIACQRLTRYSIGEETIHGSVKEFSRELPKGSIVMPFFLRDAGDIKLALEPFYTSQDPIGVIYATPQSIVHIYGDNTPASRRHARKSLAGELETYTQYLNGECYGMRTIHEDGEVDEVFGFFGSNVFENGMASNVGDEDMHVLRQAVEGSDFMMGSAKQFEEDMSQRLSRQASRARASARTRSR